MTSSKIEIHFSKSGNTVCGNYFGAYRQLDAAIAAKKFISFPQGLKISGDETTIARLADNVLTFGNCIKTLAGWQSACRLSDCVCEVSS